MVVIVIPETQEQNHPYFKVACRSARRQPASQLLVGETRSVGTRATELRSKMTADKTPSAQSRQNSASMNPLVTTLGVVLACAVIGAYSALTPGVELKWSAQRSLQQADWNGQHTVYVARSTTGYESGPLDNRRCTLVAGTSVQTRETGLDSVSCAGLGNSTKMSWGDKIAVRCWNGCHRAPNMGTSLVQYRHQYRRQTSAMACRAQFDGVIGCDLSNQGDKVVTTTTTPHTWQPPPNHFSSSGKSRSSSTFHKAPETRHIGKETKGPRTLHGATTLHGGVICGFYGVGLLLLSGYLWRQQQHSSCSSKQQQRVKLANHGP